MDELHIVVRVNGKSINVIHDYTENNLCNINLDVTAMMAYCSSLTCESCNWKFKQPILTDQAKREQLNSTKKLLNEIFQGKVQRTCVIN